MTNYIAILNTLTGKLMTSEELYDAGANINVCDSNVMYMEDYGQGNGEIEHIIFETGMTGLKVVPVTVKIEVTIKQQ